MPQTFVNAWSPMTPIGAGLQNIATALFAGGNGRNMRALDEAHAANYGASTDRARAAAALDDERRRGLVLEREAQSRAPEEVVTALFGNRPDARRFMDYRNTGSWGTHVDPAEGGGVATVQDVAPEQFTPELTRNANDELRAIAYGMAGEGKDRASNIAAARKSIADLRLRDDVIGGRVTPTRASQAMYPFSGHDPFRQNNEGSVLNVSEGTVDQTSPIAQGNVALLGAKKVTEGAHAGAYNAQGRLSDARTRQVDQESRSGVRIGPPVMVSDPEAGDIFTSPSAAVGRRPAARPGGAGQKLTLTMTGTDDQGNPTYEYVPQAVGQEVVKPGRPERPTETNAATDKQLATLVAQLFGTQDFTKIKDAAGAQAILARAEEYRRTPGSPAQGSSARAVELAARDVAPNGFDDPMFGGKGVKGGARAGLPPVARGRPDTNRPARPATPGLPPAAAPAGDPVREAYDAINKGANPAAVRQRFRQTHGVDLPSGA